MNEVAVAMFIGTFGLRITSIYVISGILLGMVGGFILGKMKLEPYLSDWVKQIQQNSTSDSGIWEKEHTPFFRRLPIIMQEAWGIVKGVLLYILIGIGIGAFMHGYVPEGFFEQYMSKDNWFAVPLSVVFAVPMYANAAGIVPVIAEIVSTVFGFRFVQPERVHSQIGVVVLAFVPNECLRFGIGGVVELVRFLIHVGYIDAVFG